MAFILTDLFSSRSSVFGSDLENIGSIDGVDIRGIDFEARLAKEIENYKTRQNTTEIPEFVQGQLRDQVWNQYLNDHVLGKQLEELGIYVSIEELGDMAYGDNPHPQVRQAFTNPQTGVFNKNDVINFLKNLDRDETGKTKNQWYVFENAIKEERKVNKYYTLIRQGLYTTKQEAEEVYMSQNKRISISFIAKRYADVPDSSVKVNESDLEDYYNKNKHRFIEKKSRKIEYAYFEILPSATDSAVLKEWVDEKFEEFKNTEDDSSFVNANSDREFDYLFYSKSDNNLSIDTTLFNEKEEGYVTEPQIINGNWKFSKISKIKFAPDSVEARHILLSFDKKDKEKVEATIDSLKAALENGADFDTLAREFSVDPGSKDQGGDLGWFKEGLMIPAINNACFKAEVNEYFTVESAFGMHLLQLTAKSEVVKKLQVAIVSRNLDASRETVDDKFTKSNDFSISLSEDADMRELAAKMNVPYNEIDIQENDNMIPEIESSRGLIRWAYNATVGQVSEALQFGNTFVVARLKEIHEDGVAPLDKVRPTVELGAIKDKKAEKFMEEMAGFTDLNDAATKLNLRIERAEGVVFESYSVPSLGREPALLGKISTMEEGDLSVPIKGANGVFIVKVESVVEPPVDENSLQSMAMQNSQGRASRVGYEVFEALKKRVEIEDNRHRIY